VAFVNVVCQAQPKTLLTRHVSEATLNGQAPLVGKLPATQSMRFDIVLALRNQPGLDNFVKEVSDPKSSSYRKFLTPSEFTARFGPSQEDFYALVRFAKASGFTVVSGDLNARDLRLTGSVANIEQAFHVSLGVYQHPTENRTFYAPDREPTVDLPFQLWHITGLKSEAVEGSCPGDSYCGSDMRAAYYGSGPLTGAGQSVGLVEYLGYDIADLNTYFKNVGQTDNVPVIGISTDGTSLTCLYADGCDDREQILDMVQAISMAPAMNAVYVYVGSSDTAILSAMASDTPLPLQLSASWTWGPNPSGDDPYFEQFAAQGQTYLTAAGDGGAYEGSALWPPNSQYVQAVGGTDLETNGAGGPWASETAWADGGGGWGTNVLIPSWQQAPGVITEANEGSTTYRDVPDISGEANFDFYTCADQEACQTGWGGTSFATPMWAGYMALLNQQAADNGVAPPGFINPAVYNIGLSSNYDNVFHDIVSGSNGLPTTVGYDLATGWGSMNGAGLINSLAGPPGPFFTLAASPNNVLVTQGNSVTTTITVTEGGGFSGNVTLSASGLPSGVTATFTPNPTASTSTLTLTASGSAATGTVVVTIAGVSGSITSSTPLNLTVAPEISGTEISLTPGSMAFGSVVVTSSSKAKVATLKNSSSSTLYINNIAVSSNFTETNNCGSTLAAGKSCTISVTFTPTETGPLTGTLSIGDNASNSPQSVSLSGTGEAQATLTPATATYSATVVGKSSAAKTFTLKNNQNIILHDLSVSTTGPFSVSSTTCQTQLTSNATCTIEVVFTPTGVGVETGTLQVSDSAVNSPQTSNLTGTGKE
jgi:kumamolisin